MDNGFPREELFSEMFFFLNVKKKMRQKTHIACDLYTNSKKEQQILLELQTENFNIITKHDIALPLLH